MIESDKLDKFSRKLFSEVIQEDCDLFSFNEKLLKQSKIAFESAERDGYEQDRITRVLNSEVVTESESDDPDSYCGVTNILSESGKKLIQKKRKAIRRRAQRLKFKTILEQRFLSRRV